MGVESFRLSLEETRLLLECRAERARLLREAAELTDAKLARKFEVGLSTIQGLGKRITVRRWIDEGLISRELLKRGAFTSD